MSHTKTHGDLSRLRKDGRIETAQQLFPAEPLYLGLPGLATTIHPLENSASSAEIGAFPNERGDPRQTHPEEINMVSPETPRPKKESGVS
jgi:hypothetical protein